jgi:hypothetical protein
MVAELGSFDAKAHHARVVRVTDVPLISAFLSGHQRGQKHGADYDHGFG